MTLDDALRIACVGVDESKSARKARSQSNRARYGVIAQQAQDSALMNYVIAAWRENSINPKIGIDSALFTAFMSGVIVGQELKKDQLI